LRFFVLSVGAQFANAQLESIAGRTNTEIRVDNGKIALVGGTKTVGGNTKNPDVPWDQTPQVLVLLNLKVLQEIGLNYDHRLCFCEDFVLAMMAVQRGTLVKMIPAVKVNGGNDPCTWRCWQSSIWEVVFKLKSRHRRSGLQRPGQIGSQTHVIYSRPRDAGYVPRVADGE